MRIISGKYKGKILEGFDLNGTRPTMDRVKESLFGIIQNHIKGCICLDLFAGSGALGFEALSNGAKKCYFVDINPQAIQTIHKNQQHLNVEEEVIFLKQEYEQALLYFYQNHISFDLIFLDPPYQKEWIQNSIHKIEQYGLLNESGILVCEYENESFNSIYTCMKEKKYGSKNIKIYINLTK